MNTIKCASYRGNPKQQVMLLLLFSIFLASSTIFAILIFDVDLTVITPFIIFISVAFFVFIFMYFKKYAAQSMEIAENELRFFDKSCALKFSLPFRDIQSMTPKPAMNFGAPDSDADLTMQVAIQLKSGTVITVLLTDAGYAQVEEKLKASPILDTGSAKKNTALYAHIILLFCVCNHLRCIHVIHERDLGIRGLANSYMALNWHWIYGILSAIAPKVQSKRLNICVNLSSTSGAFWVMGLA